MDYEVVKMHCAKCKKEVDKPSSFRTPEHLREYMITGLCQTCQDLNARRKEANNVRRSKSRESR